MGDALACCAQDRANLMPIQGPSTVLLATKFPALNAGARGSEIARLLRRVRNGMDWRGRRDIADQASWWEHVSFPTVIWAVHLLTAA